VLLRVEPLSLMAQPMSEPTSVLLLEPSMMIAAVGA
jgi:hypothetical protein